MAVNDFWRKLSGELTPSELAAGQYINPLIFRAMVIDFATGDTGAITLLQMRVFFDLPVGTDRGTEFSDLLTSVDSLPGPNGVSGAKLSLKERVIDRIVDQAVVAGRQGRIVGNPYATGVNLRLRAKVTIITFGGTPSGTLAV